MKHIFKASVKIDMQPVSADETTEQRMLREQAQARLDAFSDRVARQLEAKLREDEKIIERVDALNKEWDKLVKSGAVTFVEF